GRRNDCIRTVAHRSFEAPGFSGHRGKTSQQEQHPEPTGFHREASSRERAYCRDSWRSAAILSARSFHVAGLSAAPAYEPVTSRSTAVAAVTKSRVVVNSTTAFPIPARAGLVFES